MSASIYFILDRSGSMHTCIDDTIGGFNSFVNKQKQDNPNGKMSLFLFSDTVDVKYKNKPTKDVKEFTKDEYFPCGSTALCDAIGDAIKFADDDDDGDDNKIIVILTDGHENASKKYTKFHISDLIQHHKKWQFVFLAADQDAIMTAGDYGINNHSAMTFNKENVDDAFDGLSAAINRQVTGESQDIEFSNLERQRSCPPVKMPEVFC